MGRGKENSTARSEARLEENYKCVYVFSLVTRCLIQTGTKIFRKRKEYDICVLLLNRIRK